MLFRNRFEFCLSTRVLCEVGLARRVGGEAEQFGARRVLLLTDGGVRRAGLLEPIEESLASRVENLSVFEHMPTAPSLAAAEEAAARARELSADLLVAVGGGSVIDTAKCARLLAGAGGRLADYVGGIRLEQPLPPLIALPTTAGTGSEVSPVARIYDEASGQRLRLKDQALAPSLALLDPELTRSLSPLLTAATGMHALSHCVEAFVSTRTNPFVDGIALYAIDLIANYLRDATHNVDDLSAHSAMLIASSMAGMALANSAPGVVGAMAEAVANSHAIHPGAIHSIVLPFGMQFNCVAVPNRYQRIARALGIVAGGRAEIDVIGDSVTEVRSMAADCNLPLRLRDVGVRLDELARLAGAAATDTDLGSNPRPVVAADILHMLEEAW